MKVTVPVGPEAPGVYEPAVRAVTVGKVTARFVEAAEVIRVAPAAKVGVVAIGVTVMLAGVPAVVALKLASPEYDALMVCVPPESIGL